MPLIRDWVKPQPKTYYDVKAALSKYRLIINQGGTRSGKTFSTLQVLIELCIKNENKGLTISIVRKTFPALKATAYRDFITILQAEGIYDESCENKTELTYWLFGNRIEFFSLDNSMKVRGRKRNICFINEANELTFEEYFQLNMRTEDRMILDFNPSDEFCWIYELEANRAAKGDCILFVTNYTHNPKLPQSLIEEIELLETADEEYWNVYGKGERGASRELIFTHWKVVKELPGIMDPIYGQDFGFNNPSSLVKVELLNNCIYVDELLYRPKLITAEIAEFYDSINLSLHSPIYCDSAAPDKIEELERMGFNALKAKKDVFEGINKVKSMPLFVTERSVNLIKELKNYKWKKDPKTEKVLDEPVKFNDHATDALRYAVYSHTAMPKQMHSYSDADYY